MMSGFQAVAKSSSAGNPPEVKVSPPMTSIDDSVAIDPVEYVGVPLSFHDFEPDGDIVDDDWMPGKPSSPLGPVFRFYFHFIHPFILVCARRTLEHSVVWGCRDQTMSWISVVPSS
jgi:hypothetical protein